VCAERLKFGSKTVARRAVDWLFVFSSASECGTYTCDPIYRMSPLCCLMVLLWAVNEMKPRETSPQKTTEKRGRSHFYYHGKNATWLQYVVGAFAFKLVRGLLIRGRNPVPGWVLYTLYSPSAAPCPLLRWLSRIRNRARRCVAVHVLAVAPHAKTSYLNRCLANVATRSSVW